MVNTLDLKNYHLTFDDEFNAFASSPAGGAGTWKTTFYGGARTLPDNGEQQFYSDATAGANPFALKTGVLDITAMPSSGAGSNGLPYTSGLITSESSFSQTYGYFEMRAKLPDGKGMWPAFWLLPTDKSWPPEIDALEAFGAPNSRGEGGSNTYHWGAIGGGGAWAKVDANVYDSYHRYGVDWQADKITYYFDGQQVGQIDTPPGFNKPMYMLANLAVGGHWAENPAGETAHLDIDYIRAYSKASDAHTISAQPVSSPDGVDTSISAPTVAPQPTETLPAAVLPQTGGPNKLVLHVSEDAWQGDARFIVAVDGRQIGSALTATASHSAKQWQDFTASGDFGPGAHKVAVTFLEDAWGGTAASDRNLYINGLELDGQHYDLAAALETTNSTATVQTCAPSATIASTAGNTVSGVANLTHAAVPSSHEMTSEPQQAEAGSRGGNTPPSLISPTVQHLHDGNHEGPVAETGHVPILAHEGFSHIWQ